MCRPYFSVKVQTQYLPDLSFPEAGIFVFSYTITITNTGDITAQLISRTWSINDAAGVMQKVQGSGVVGEQPVLAPGESFKYTSACRLSTPTGTMHGQFHCVADDGTAFNADVPLFVLDALSHLGDRPTLH